MPPAEADRGSGSDHILAALAGTGAALLVAGRGGRVVSLNPAAVALTGFPWRPPPGDRDE